MWFFVAVAFYFGLASAVLALVFLPPVRAWALARTRRLGARSRSATGALATTARRGLSQTASSLVTAQARGGGWLRRNARWVALVLAVVAAPSLLALALRNWQELSSYDHTASRAMNEQVAALLRGEDLVPPPTLPPELFTTPEVEQARPLIRYASRQWDLLDDDFRKRLLIVFKLMQERHGYEMVLLEGFRTPERQNQLASFGRNVTRAGAFESYHQYGLAADSAFRRDGRIVITETDPWAMRGYELYGETAASLGLTWGGGWTSLKDYGHVELRRPGVLRRKGDNPAPATAQEQ